MDNLNSSSSQMLEVAGDRMEADTVMKTNRIYFDGPSTINGDEHIHARYFTYRSKEGLVAGASLNVMSPCRSALTPSHSRVAVNKVETTKPGTASVRIE